jgi:hypothetical protein
MPVATQVHLQGERHLGGRIVREVQIPLLVARDQKWRAWLTSLDRIAHPRASPAAAGPEIVRELRERYESEIRLRFRSELVLLNGRVITRQHDASVPLGEISCVVKVRAQRTYAGCPPDRERRRKVEEGAVHVQEHLAFANAADPRPLREPPVRRIVGVGSRT